MNINLNDREIKYIKEALAYISAHYYEEHEMEKEDTYFLDKWSECTKIWIKLNEYQNEGK